jgi:leucyl aminopeptidase (aminopeptidase T)
MMRVARESGEVCQAPDQMARYVRITNADGTDISMSLEGRVGNGRYWHLPRRADSSGNLPAGEAFIAPVEGTANGVFVVDGAMAGTKFAGTKIRDKCG